LILTQTPAIVNGAGRTGLVIFDQNPRPVEMPQLHKKAGAEGTGVVCYEAGRRLLPQRKE